LESPPDILEVEDIISNVEASCSSQERPILYFGWAGTPEIGGSDSVESS